MRLPALLIGGLLAGATHAAAPVGGPGQGDMAQRLLKVERQASRITDLVLKVQALQHENRELRGRIEEQDHAIEALKRKQRDLYLDIDERLARIGGTPAPVMGAAPAPATTKPAPVTTATAVATAKPATPTPAPVVDPAKEQAAYQAAKDMLLKEPRRYKEAKVAFREYLAKYPFSANAPRAQYWLAEASYVVGDNSSALADYQQILERFPTSDMVPGALLKIGYIHDSAGRHAEARAALERVVTEYPDSLPAPKAQERLDRIAKKGR